MFDSMFIVSFDSYVYNFIEDVFTLLMLYSFSKLILLSSIVELIWPTHFFNKRHCTGILKYRIRSYTEVFLKLQNVYPYLYNLKLRFMSSYVI